MPGVVPFRSRGFGNSNFWGREGHFVGGAAREMAERGAEQCICTVRLPRRAAGGGKSPPAGEGGPQRTGVYNKVASGCAMRQREQDAGGQK